MDMTQRVALAKRLEAVTVAVAGLDGSPASRTRLARARDAYRGAEHHPEDAVTTSAALLREALAAQGYRGAASTSTRHVSALHRQLDALCYLPNPAGRAHLLGTMLCRRPE